MNIKSIWIILNMKLQRSQMKTVKSLQKRKNPTILFEAGKQPSPVAKKKKKRFWYMFVSYEIYIICHMMYQSYIYDISITGLSRINTCRRKTKIIQYPTHSTTITRLLNFWVYYLTLPYSICNWKTTTRQSFAAGFDSLSCCINFS